MKFGSDDMIPYVWRTLERGYIYIIFSRPFRQNGIAVIVILDR